ANLLLARSAVRQREIAIRTALGAKRLRIIRQLLTESVLLSMLGGIFGCLLAYFTLTALKAMLPVSATGPAHVAIDGRVLAFAAVLSLLTGLVFGLAPAWQTAKTDVEQALKANAHSAGTGQKRTKFSAGLVVVEVALAVVLVSGAGLLIKSLWFLSQLS